MTLIRRETQPVSEGQSIIRSHYFYQPLALAGMAALPATTVTQQVVVLGSGVNYDANRGVGQPRWVASNGALAASVQPGVAFESSAAELQGPKPLQRLWAVAVLSRSSNRDDRLSQSEHE